MRPRQKKGWLPPSSYSTEDSSGDIFYKILIILASPTGFEPVLPP